MQLRSCVLGVFAMGLLCDCSSSPPARSLRGSAVGGTAAGTGAAANGGTVAVVPIGGSAPIIPPPPPVPSAGTAGTTPTLSSREPVVIDKTGADNPAGASTADVDKLRAGNPVGAALKWLYPYTNTVFPRGMGAPLFMWEGPAADAVWLHIKARSFEYTTVLKPMAAGRVQIPQDVWDQAGRQTNGQGDDFNFELSTLGGGTVSKAVSSRFNIAQATIKGSIYYNSYTSSQSVLPGGTVFRIPAGGGMAAAFVSTGCNGCHSVSADGSKLISQFSGAGGQSFELAVGGMANPPGNQAGPRGNFAALYPDGSKYLSTSVVIDVARTFMTQGLGAPQDATLYNAATGANLPNVGIPTGALMPMFSPDGTRLVFNDYA
ncbi:MAG: hypothetical protein RL701_5004, partial [Pseudomonadota bacterium]